VARTCRGASPPTEPKAAQAASADARQYLPVRGALLLVWVGLFALFRGISEIVIAFEVRNRQRA
jgi:hypothetical protein